MVDVPPSGPGPLPRRAGVLTLIFLTIIAIGLAVGSMTAPTEADSSDDPVSTGILEIGSPAPDFEVELLDGSMFRLSEHLATDGRPLVLNLWASWCPPCRAEMPDFNRFAASKPGIAVIGVAIEDDEAAARAFVEELGIDYLIGLDEAGVIGTRYPYLGLPATWVIGSDGTLRREVIGQVTFEFLNEIVAQEFGFRSSGSSERGPDAGWRTQLARPANS